MADATQQTGNPVEDSVPKVDDSIAVGEDLEFQRTWWRMERVVWIVFLLLLIFDLLGGLGRGWLANAQRTTADGALHLTYERIERAGTPSIMTLHFGPGAIHDGHIQVFVSDSVIRPLGAQRVSPQPLASTLSREGITYTFSASDGPTVAEIALQPSFPGSHSFRMTLLGGASPQPIDARVVVVP